MSRPDDKNQSQDLRPAEWERALLERFAFAALKEQRAARRWGIFFKLVFVGYLAVALITLYADLGHGWPGGGDADEESITALVDLQGVIAAGTPAAADTIVAGLRDAFEYEKTKGVILRINSPGGSPVQSGYINDEIARLRAEYPEIPLIAVIEDLGASGGYYVAVGADEIYANKASLVGSIGVRMDGFGFVEGMHRLGIERRLLTAGENKGFLDPFSPVNPAHVAHVEGVLADVHAQFIDVVREGRGARLKEMPDLFSGYIWTGEQALDLGLVDGLGSAGFVAREIFEAETILDFTPRESWLDQLTQGVSAELVRLGAETLLPRLDATFSGAR